MRNLHPGRPDHETWGHRALDMLTSLALVSPLAVAALDEREDELSHLRPTDLSGDGPAGTEPRHECKEEKRHV